MKATILAFFCCLAHLSADVIINEISGRNPERLLKWSDRGQPSLGSGTAWFESDFNDSTWSSGTAPFGFGFDDIATDLAPRIQGTVPSFYLRKTFSATADQASSGVSLQFEVEYDDGFIAYINGVEVVRCNMGPAQMFIYADQFAFNAGSTSGNPETITIDAASAMLIKGNNVLAIHVANRDSNSPIKFDTTLRLGAGGTQLVESGSAWNYTDGNVEPSGGVFEPAFAGLPEPLPLPDPIPSQPVAEFTDWIELYNDGASAVDLTGWTLSDDAGNPSKWTFPQGTHLAAGGYLVVLADGYKNTGFKTTYLHANFRLAAGGEYLGLFDELGIVQDQFAPEFPGQIDFHSYGTKPGGTGLGFLATPTPGATNKGAYFTDKVAKPDFDVPGGFHTGNVTLNITTTTPGATIRYTTDGSEPTENSTVYTGALELSQIDSRTAHSIRARAYSAGLVPSRTRSASYLIDQSSNLRQVPALMITADEGRSLYEPFGVLSISGGEYVNKVWQAIDKGDYNMAMERGRAVERPVFLEYYFADTLTGFREDAGIRFAASGSARPRSHFFFVHDSPWINSPREKPSFNIFFRNEYEDGSVTLPMHGAGYPVNTFEQLRLRAGKNDITAPFIRDEFMRRLYIDMGQVGSRGVFNSLYVNGKWKGYYNTCERLREPFFQAHHDGGQWDIIQAGNPNGGLAEGDLLAWNELNSRLQAGNVNDQAAWDYALELVDPIAIADYFLLNIYGATWDWPNNNYVTARQRSAEGKFRFYVWDAEGAFGRYGHKPKSFNTIQTDLLSGPKRHKPTPRLFQRMERWPEFKLIMADRIQRHFFNGGTLDTSTPATSRAQEIVDKCVEEFEPLNIERGLGEVNLAFWSNWVASPSRRSYLLGGNANHFRDAGYWPNTAPPSFNQHGGDVPTGFQLAITSSTGGTIYYTLDGSDPRNFGGTVSSTAQNYISPPTLVNALTVAKARVRSSGGEWSALTEAKFNVATVPTLANNLVVAEFLYHPMDANAAELAAGFTDKDDFEFIQLLNIGTQAIDLSEVDFTAGIGFDFGTGALQVIDPAAYVIVVKNLDAFRLRYGSGYDSMIAGEYSGRLSNGGEQIVLSGPGGSTLHDFTYDDTAPWPIAADGYGGSLKLVNANANPDHALARNWVTPVQFGGLPGGIARSVTFDDWLSYFFSDAELADPQISGPAADSDADNLPNLLEYAIGALPGISDDGERAPRIKVVEDGGQDWFEISIRVLDNLTDILLTAEVPSDLRQGDSSPDDFQEIFPPTPHGDGTTTRTFRDQVPLARGTRRIVRIRVSTR